MVNGRRFEGKVALVTGSANGIGRAMVRALLAEGARVAALDIETDALSREFGAIADVLAIPCDVSKNEQVDAAVQQAIAQFGRIDVCFSNAGLIGRTSLLETDVEDWRHTIDVNVNGMFYVNQAVLRHMVEAGIKGAVVNTSSVASVCVSANTGAYSASKGAVSQLTKWAALEMAPYGIRVNAIGPGTHATRLTEGTRLDPQRNRKFLANIPLGRYGEPEEAAAAALFLASDEASYITGATLLEDGGFSLF